MTQPISATGVARLAARADANPSRKGAAPNEAAVVKHTHSKTAVDTVHISHQARHRHAAQAATQPGTGQSSSASSMSTADAIMRDMRMAFHSREGDDNFNAGLDFNKDGAINAQDLGIARRKIAGGPAQGPVTIIDDQTQSDDPRQTLSLVRDAFHTRRGDDNFNSAADLNKDGVVNTQDLGLARAGMGGGDTTQPIAPSPLSTDTAAVHPDTTDAAAVQPAPTVQDLRNAFFSSTGDDNFNAAADLNNDGVVNAQDLGLARASMGAGDTTQPVADSPLSSNAADAQSFSIVQQLRNAFFSSEGDDNFNSRLDTNADGRINVADMIAAQDRLRADRD